MVVEEGEERESGGGDQPESGGDPIHTIDEVEGVRDDDNPKNRHRQAQETEFEVAVEGVGEARHAQSEEEDDNRRQDLDQLGRYSDGFEDVGEFLGQLALLAGVDGEPTKGAEKQDRSEALTLSSVHQAKGLEWRVVFIIWLTDGMFPNARVIEEDDDEGSGLEEERRLFYVAVTRAKDELYLLYPQMWPSSRSGDIMQRPSRFLDDFPAGLVEEWQVGGSTGLGW